MGFENMSKEIGKIIEQTTKNVEKSLKDIDKRIDISNNIKELKASKIPEPSKDIDKRIDIKQKAKEIDLHSKDKFDIDSRIDVKGIKKTENNQLGGSYKDLKNSQNYDSEKHEIHHMPADSINELNTSDGPAIIMDKRDHRKTASCGNTKEAKAYRDKQSEYINKGNFDKAVEMDIKDIQDKFEDKYDKQIAEMKEYINELKKRGDI